MTFHKILFLWQFFNQKIFVLETKFGCAHEYITLKTYWFVLNMWDCIVVVYIMDHILPYITKFHVNLVAPFK